MTSSQWDDFTDVVVVGFGAAGACAALAAREHGAEVIAIDRFNGGGATRLSGGIIYAGAGTAVQRSAGVEDSVEQMLAYLRLEVGDAVSAATLEAFVRSTPAMIDWLGSHGVPFDAALCPYKTSYPNNRYYLYYSGSENSGGFAERTPPVQRGHRVKGKGTSGKKLYAPLADSAQARGVRLQPHTAVTALVRDDSGRVAGVAATTMRHAPAGVQKAYAALAAVAAKPGVYYPPLRNFADARLRHLERRFGRRIRIRARAGVVLCAGGFIANTDWIGSYAPQFTGGLALGSSGDDGSGIRLAADVGAVPDRMDNVSVWRFIAPPSAFLSALVVDRAGRRILDESRYGAALGQAMVTRHGGQAWILADAALIRQARRQVIGQTIWFQRLQFAALMLFDAVRGRSLEQVAHRAGIDPAGLAATVAANNAAVDAGGADPVGKPAAFARRVGAGPYTLLNVSVRPSVVNPTPMLTLGGVRVDEATGAVVDATGAAIPGLYAAGRTAIGVCSKSYVSGLSLADCVFSGRRAGAHVVGATDSVGR